MYASPRYVRPENQAAFDYKANPQGYMELRKHLSNREVVEIPAVVAGKRIYSDNIYEIRAPHDTNRLLARVHLPTEETVLEAINSSQEVAKEWAALPFEKRASIFLRVAGLLDTVKRQELTAVTMLGQSKTVYQGEPDAGAEIIDFMRFNTFAAQEIYDNQPLTVKTAVNRTEWRPLEGFIYAVSPFNFTAIGANLSCAPALMGNVVLWKPSLKSALANWKFYEILEQCGLPPGVINFLPSEPVMTTRLLTESRDFAGLHYTGSSQVFTSLWQSIGSNVGKYRNYPRIVGENGGKGFILAHPSAEPLAVATAMLRDAFEYQGQKCSAGSRAYIPKSLWPAIKESLCERLAKLKVGDIEDPTVYMGAVIDEVAHKRLSGWIERSKADSNVQLVFGGKTWVDPGWFVEPTVFEVSEPNHPLMREELFGPIQAVYVYDDSKWDEILSLVDGASEYSLTGSIYCYEQAALIKAEQVLVNTAGNLSVNARPSGATMGQQPFGGSRASGTNDKAGSSLNLMRWTSPRVIKEATEIEREYDFKNQIIDWKE